PAAGSPSRRMATHYNQAASTATRQRKARWRTFTSVTVVADRTGRGQRTPSWADAMESCAPAQQTEGHGWGRTRVAPSRHAQPGLTAEGGSWARGWKRNSGRAKAPT